MFDQKSLSKQGGTIYKIPVELRKLNSQQRMRVLSARAEQAKQKADENLLAFAAKTHPHVFSALNFFAV